MELRNIPRKDLQRYRNGISELGIFYFAGKFIEIELFELWQQLKRKSSRTRKNRFALMFYSNSASKKAVIWSWIKFLDMRIKEDKLLAMVHQEMQASKLNTQAPTRQKYPNFISFFPIIIFILIFILFTPYFIILSLSLRWIKSCALILKILTYEYYILYYFLYIYIFYLFLFIYF